VEFLEKRRAARAVTVAAIKHLGHAPLLAEALVEALHTGRPPTPSKRLPPKSHTLWWAPEPWLTRAVPRDYRGRNPFRRWSRPDRRVGSGQPLAWDDGPRMARESPENRGFPPNSRQTKPPLLATGSRAPRL